MDIDDCIEQGLATAEIIKNDLWEHAVPLEKHRSFSFGGVS